MQLTSTCIFTSPLFPKKKKKKNKSNKTNRTNSFATTPLTIAISFSVYTNFKIDTLIFKSRNFLTPPKRLLSTCYY